MSEKRFQETISTGIVIDTKTGIEYNCEMRIDDKFLNLVNELVEENEQLKQQQFICLECKYGGYTDIGCLCEKEDCWVEFTNKCDDFEVLKYD